MATCRAIGWNEHSYEDATSVGRHVARTGNYCFQHVVWSAVKEFGIGIFNLPARRIQTLIIVGNVVNTWESIKSKVAGSRDTSGGGMGRMPITVIPRGR